MEGCVREFLAAAPHAAVCCFFPGKNLDGRFESSARRRSSGTTCRGAWWRCTARPALPASRRGLQHSCQQPRHPWWELRASEVGFYSLYVSVCSEAWCHFKPKALATLTGYAAYPANRLPRLPLFRISASVARLLDNQRKMENSDAARTQIENLCLPFTLSFKPKGHKNCFSYHQRPGRVLSISRFLHWQGLKTFIIRLAFETFTHIHILISFFDNRNFPQRKKHQHTLLKKLLSLFFIRKL